MASVYHEMELCPRCKKESQSYGHYYRTGEGWSYCSACGDYHYGFVAVGKGTGNYTDEIHKP